MAIQEAHLPNNPSPSNWLDLVRIESENFKRDKLNLAFLSPPVSSMSVEGVRGEIIQSAPDCFNLKNVSISCLKRTALFDGGPKKEGCISDRRLICRKRWKFSTRREGSEPRTKAAQPDSILHAVLTVHSRSPSVRAKNCLRESGEALGTCCLQASPASVGWKKREIGGGGTDVLHCLVIVT